MFPATPTCIGGVERVQADAEDAEKDCTKKKTKRKDTEESRKGIFCFINPV